MVLVATYREIQAITDVLAEAGYGYSCLGDPGDADPDEVAVVADARRLGLVRARAAAELVWCSLTLRSNRYARVCGLRVRLRSNIRRQNPYRGRS